MTEISYGAFKEAAHFHRGRISPIRIVVVHCTAGPESASGRGAENIMNMFADPSSRVASAQLTGDQDSIARSVHDADTAFGAVYANSCGLHFENVGMPDQSEAQWLDAVSKATLLNCARATRDWCNLYGLRKGTLTDAQLHDVLNNPHGTKFTGITTHAQVERVMPSTGHTDPGPHFPMSWFIEQVAGQASHVRPLPLVGNPFTRPVVSQDAHTFLRVGSTGTGVKFVQWALGYTGAALDGNLGPATLASLQAWQRRAKLPVTDVVGPGSLAHLAGIKHHAA